ncbi:MAG: mercuric reductase [Anaerolineae bacterium]|nr:mercuric reductase [Anaerolineae bacterium]
MPEITLIPNDVYNQELIQQAHPPDWINPTPNGRYNLLVIGGGSAGLVCAVGAAGVGAKVALVEKHLLGGDCLNTGCVPSKSVIRSAKVMGEIQKAADFGVHVPAGVTADFGQVMTRMRRIRADISHHDSAQRFADMGIDVFLGEGKFTSETTFAVGNKTIEFKKAVIATGSRAANLPIPGLAETGYITNETFFQLEERPLRLAVIGAGPIGSELAQAMQRFGSQVSIFDIIPQVLGREDAEAAAIVQAQMEKDGMTLFLEANISQVRQTEAGKIIEFTINDQTNSLLVDEILLAVGRRPNVESLDLEAAQIGYTNKGVVINDTLQTTNKNVYAAGDVALSYQFTHTADAAARIVLQNALFLGRQKFSSLTIPWVTYTDPEVAHVGLYPADAAAQGIEIDTFTTYLHEIDRGRADGEEAGFVKIHVKKGSDKILGATIVGSHAGDMISEVTLAMVGGLGLKTIQQVIHPYPTLAEAIRKCADAWNRTRLTPTVAKLFDKWLAWNR